MSEGRKNAIIIALVVSVIAHIGVMLWMKPKVMTEVARGFQHVARRINSVTREALPEDTPTAMDIFQDEEAKKDAPEADDETVGRGAALANLSELPLNEVAELEMPRPAEIRESLETYKVIEAPNRFDTTPVGIPAPVPESQELERMTFETPTQPGPTAGAHRLPPPESVALEDVTVQPSEDVAPDFSALEESAKEPETEKLVKEAPAEAFKPESEVMKKVDEERVAAEKEAVRDLVNSYEAEEMTTAVNTALTREYADGWTYFKVHITPKPNLPIISKDLVVLMDTSPSVGRDRLRSCMQAAKQLLVEGTNSGDRFNVVSFSDKFEYAFPAWQECTRASFDQAERWMDNRALHGWTDVFGVISSVLTLPRDPKRPLIALVVTDGDANAGVSSTAKILSKFSELNDGLISVYMYGVKKSANAELLDYLTRGNRGESLIYRESLFKSRAEAGSEIVAFAKRFAMPLVTDLRVVFAADTKAEVYPKLLRNLYRGNSVDLIGRVKGQPAEIAFSLKGLAGDRAYESFYRLPLASARPAEDVEGAYRAEVEIAEKCR